MAGYEHRILEEEAAWDAIVANVLGDGAQLVSVSRDTPDSRLYRRGARAAKIRTRASPLPGPSMERKAQELRVRGLDAHYASSGSWEILTRPWIEGDPLATMSAGLRFGERLALFRRLLEEVVRLRRVGVGVGDLHPETIVVSGDAIWLLGYGHAVERTAGDRHALPRLLAGVLFPDLKRWRERLGTLFQGTARTPVPPDDGQAVSAEEGSWEHEIELLRQAWHLGRTGGENSSPYYAFTYRGVHFPGGRPWYLRWEPIRHSIDFRNKRVIELGCNMGLLSSFAMIHGAASAIGVDHEPDIVESARLVARALSSGAEFETIDLGADRDWEKELGSADIVTMLSVWNWLSPETQQRALRFLGRHGEVLYEGHDPLDVEVARLQSAGFHDVRVLATTDRNRCLLHGRSGRALR
jgi:hypothetical protein